MTNISDSAIINVELLATCGALGYFEDGTYLKEPDCLESLKDLIRYLRRDDEAHDIRRQLGDVNVLQTDLLPILKYHSEDNVLFDAALRLLVNLTNPVILLYHEELPEEKVTRNYYLQIATHLQKYKQAFVDSALWNVLCNKLTLILELEWTDRQEEDKLIVERILILLRNVLHVPANPEEEKRTDDDVSIHDQVIWALHTSNMIDLLIYIAASDDEEEFSFHILEIVSHILREQTPRQLADDGCSRSDAEKEKDVRELKALRARELERKSLQSKTPTRHPRFGGTFCVKNVKSISERDLICHKPLAGIEATNFDSQKKIRRVAKNRLPMQDANLHRRSTLSIRNFLKEMCIDLLNNAYNPLMATVKNQLSHRRTQDHDETYYLWSMRFFMEFNRLYDFDVARIGETISVQSFYYVQTQMENYQDVMMTEKKKVHVWSKRMHIALSAYHELLMTLGAMEASQDTKVQNSAKVLKGNIFYVVEYRDLLLHLLMNYNEVKFPKSYLRELVLTSHTFMKMLESACKAHKTLIVQNKKKTVGRKKKKTSANRKSSAPVELSEEQLEQSWDDLSNGLSARLQLRDGIDPDIRPFDAALERTVEEQRADAVVKIQDYLRSKRSAEAVSLFRAAREVWPENDVFGIPNMELDREFMALREIFFANLPRPSSLQPLEATPSREDEIRFSDPSDDEREKPSEKISEQVFDFFDFLKRFASPRVVQPYVLLLRQYEQNDVQTNRCLLRMMHRIAWDCKMYGLFFQASLFRIFQRILSDPSRHTDPTVKELCRFAVFIIRKFFENASKNEKVFMEILFWKSAREVYEIQEGYGSTQKNKESKVLWTEEEEEELKSLYEQYKDVQEDGKDVVDLILEHMIDDTKSRRQVIKQLKILALLAPKTKLTSARSIRPPLEWREEEVAQLHTLFEQYKGATDIMGRITDNMTIKRPKHRVIEKLLELGLVKDRKELRKKRESKKNKNTADDGRRESGDESEEEDELEDSDDDVSDVVRHEKPLDLPSLKEAFTGVMASEFRPALQWVKLALESVQEDRDDRDEPQSTPLVPLLETHQNAMQSSVFQNFLGVIGITPPANEQESFWRIPSTLSSAALRLRVEAIHKAEKGELDGDDHSLMLSLGARATTNPENVMQKQKATKRSRSSGSFKEKRSAKRQRISDVDEISAFASERREEEEIKSDGDSSDSERQQQQQHRQENKHLTDDEAVSMELSLQKRTKKRRSRILNVDSDSEPESRNDEMLEEDYNSDGGDVFSRRKRKRVAHSDDDSPKDGSDVEDRRISTKKIRKRIVIESDDEEA